MRKALDKMKEYDEYMNATDWNEIVNDKNLGIII